MARDLNSTLRILPQSPARDADSASHAREVILIEAAALAELADTIGPTFAGVVDLVLQIRGRIVVTGMGKSGHVARKIAATFASTGTPAIFVHPAEASHGDLGMLLPDDMLLALSNSGGTTELQAIVGHAAHLGVPIVGITSRANSWLSREADMALLLPPAQEACPANIAPTTSTMMMMALGDAMAMSAMRRRGFSRQGFQLLHPGGQIGLRLQTVAAMMHTDESIPLAHPSDAMHDVIVTMTGKSFGAAGIVDASGRLVGVITDGDLRRHAEQLGTSTASEVMNADPVTIDAGARAEDALELMNEHRITSLFVTSRAKPGEPVGIVHIHDFLRLGLA